MEMGLSAPLLPPPVPSAERTAPRVLIRHEEGMRFQGRAPGLVGRAAGVRGWGAKGTLIPCHLAPYLPQH